MRYFLLLLMFSATTVFSQSFKSSLPDITTEEKTPPLLQEKVFYGTDAFIIEKKLEERFHCQLKQDYFIESPYALHYTFRQTVSEIPVYGKFIKINLDKAGNSVSLSVQLSCSPVAASVQTGNVWIEKENKLIPGIKKIICYDQFCEDIVYGQNGEIISRIPLSLSKTKGRSTDTTISVTVFIPDPLTSANVNYGAPYSDQNNAEVTELNAQLFPSATTGSISNDTFYLENSFVKITDHSLPSVAPPWSMNSSFLFTRGNANFEETHILFHITRQQQWIQLLGFTNLVNYQIHADAHGLNGADNSNFNPASSPPRLTFGDGGVDDGEDADVILHEYAHAVSYSAAPGTTVGNERLAIEEGNADYFAASWSKSIDPYNWQNVYSWDGHNEFWAGRMVQSIKTYPADITGNFYQDAEIWSSTLMQIWDDIGRTNTDRILLQSLYSYTSNMTMPQAATLFIQADSLLNGGANYIAICTRFSDRGILNCPLEISEQNNDSPVILFNNGLEVIFPSSTLSEIMIYDITGKLVLQKKYNSDKLIIQLPETGVYIAKVLFEGKVLHTKFVQL
ncbi:MAG: T9SS type A sorting domain-containing protein [Bacteroidota bacterium]